MKNIQHYIFKNILAYKIKTDFNLIDELSKNTDLLKTHYTPCQPTEKSKIGWDKIVGEEYVYQADRYLLLSLKKEDKLLPKEVVEEELKERVENLEEKEQRKLKKVEKQSIKDDVIHTLLPRAFSKYSNTNLIIDKIDKIIYIDTSSTKKAEEILAVLRKDLETLPVVPLTFNKELGGEFKGLLTNDIELVKTLSIGDEFGLSGDGIYNCKEVVYTNDDFQDFLSDKEVDKILFVLEEKGSFVLDTSGQVKKIKIEEISKEKTQDEQEALQLFDSNFVIMSKTITEIYELLKKQFGGCKDFK